MWSSDVQGGYPTQWALNPSAYQNMSNEEVDWAQLAQQWIKMKETFPADQVPPAPPPPTIGNQSKAVDDVEGGEAPMDMDNKEEGDTTPAIPPAPPAPSVGQDPTSWGSWNNWQQWGWNWGGAGQPPPGGPSSVEGKAPPYQFTAPPAAGHSYTAEPSTTFEYNHGGSVEQFSQQPPPQQHSGYWVGDTSTPYMRPKSSDWRGRSSSGGHRSSRPEAKAEVDDEAVAAAAAAIPVLDAAKRKQLPAWIREGLEKMEKEKLKKQERERMLKERALEMTRRKEMEEQAAKDGVLLRSKFETDSEESEDDEERHEVEPQVQPRRSRFDQVASAKLATVSPKLAIAPASPPPPPPVHKTKEQIMQETMLKVRKVLTEILMSVTTEEIQLAVTEVHSSVRAKAPAMQLRKTPALTSLTGKLGLGIYGSDDSEASQSEDEGSDQDAGHDSDQELRDRIRKRKQEFAKIEKEIVSNIEEQEERERQQLAEEEEEAEPEVEEEEEKKAEAVAGGAVAKEQRERLGGCAENGELADAEDAQVDAKLVPGLGFEAKRDVDIRVPSARQHDDAPDKDTVKKKKKKLLKVSSGDGSDDDKDVGSSSSSSSSSSTSSSSSSSSSESSDSSSESSHSSRSSRRKKKYARRRKEKKGGKEKRKRSRSRSGQRRSGRRKSSYDSYRAEGRKDGRREHRREKERTRDHSRSRESSSRSSRRHGDPAAYPSSYSRHSSRSPSRTSSHRKKSSYRTSSSRKRRRSSSSSAASGRGSRSSYRTRD